jgi:hypothetical protein
VEPLLVPHISILGEHINDINSITSSFPYCHVKFELGEEACQLYCGHKYHQSCITSWMRYRNKCPFVDILLYLNIFTKHVIHKIFIKNVIHKNIFEFEFLKIGKLLFRFEVKKPQRCGHETQILLKKKSMKEIENACKTSMD